MALTLDYNAPLPDSVSERPKYAKLLTEFQQSGASYAEVLGAKTEPHQLAWGLRITIKRNADVFHDIYIAVRAGHTYIIRREDEDANE